jgi:hypothetical protein
VKEARELLVATPRAPKSGQFQSLSTRADIIHVAFLNKNKLTVDGIPQNRFGQAANDLIQPKKPVIEGRG